MDRAFKRMSPGMRLGVATFFFTVVAVLQGVGLPIQKESGDTRGSGMKNTKKYPSKNSLRQPDMFDKTCTKVSLQGHGADNMRGPESLGKWFQRIRTLLSRIPNLYDDK